MIVMEVITECFKKVIYEYMEMCIVVHIIQANLDWNSLKT